MQQAKDTILKAIALIENPEAWTQGASAQDSAGLPVPPESPQACRWCTLGAIDKASNYDYNRWLEATRQIRDVLRGKPLPYLSPRSTTATPTPKYWHFYERPQHEYATS